MKVTIVRGRAIDSAVYKLARSLARNGYDVQLLVWDRQNTYIEQSGDYTIRKFTLQAPYDRYRALFYVPFWCLYQLWFLLRDRCDIVHACDLDTLIPAILAKLVKKYTLFYTIYDFYANNLPNGRFPIIRNFLRKAIAGMEKFGIGCTQVLFLVDECRHENVKGARIHKLSYIYNSPEDRYLDPITTGPPPSSIKAVIFYAGIIHPSRGIEHLINSVVELGNIELVIAGIGPDVNIVKRAIGHNNNISYLGQIPYEDVIRRSLKADIIFAMYDPAVPTNQYASPNKLFEAMMCGKPIIVSDCGSLADTVKRENCGIAVPYGAVDKIKNAILMLTGDPQLRKYLGMNGRQAYESKYSWNIMQKKLLTAYEYFDKKEMIEAVENFSYTK
jgi:glycosyltransferase involved in cell wall biosynthesis